jgi:Kef-type K+ transport system membrane component KefB/mannitol/fructose-specific phosphotransferase system IIA component (Ntr-type)
MMLLAATLSHSEITTLLLSVAVLLGSARLFGEIAKSFQQPAVLGEILAGILLGPTVLGAISPEWGAFLFPKGGAVETALHGLVTVAVVFFLLVAGMEVDLSMAWKSGRTALLVAVTGLLVPFLLGFTLAWVFPSLLRIGVGVEHHVFALFVGTALSISALPVIARILLDLKLFKTDIGMIVISAAMLNDLTGWFLFAIVLSMMGGAGHGGVESLAVTIGATTLFAVLMLTVGRALLHRVLPWVQASTSPTSGVLGFAMTLALLCAALTEWLGIHAIFGSFIFGVALGDTRHLKERVRTSVDQFISSIFAPLFFASIGLKVNFFAHFDWVIVTVVLLVATLGKVLGCGYGAVLGGMSRREALAVGFGMNARGAMEIILGLLALEAGVIGEEMFVALVIMALVTSMMSGACIQKLLQRKRPIDFTSFVSSSLFKLKLDAATRREAVAELSALVATKLRRPAAEIAAEVMEKEDVMPTGIGNRVAVPHARVEGLERPMIAVGLSESGIDFDAPDGEPARIIFLILTPLKDTAAHLEILAGIARAASSPFLAEELTKADNFGEVLSALKAGDEKH